jgi:hypothetical protein
LCAAIVDQPAVGGDIIETCPPQPAPWTPNPLTCQAAQAWTSLRWSAADRGEEIVQPSLGVAPGPGGATSRRWLPHRAQRRPA